MIEAVGAVIAVIAVIAVMFALYLMSVAAGAVILSLFDREQKKELEAEPDTE